KGRVVLAEDIRLLEQSLSGAGRSRHGAEATAFRVRVRAGEDTAARGAALRRLCEEHPGGVPIYVHVLLPATEVVMRSRGASVEPTQDLVARVEELLRGRTPPRADAGPRSVR